MMRTATETIAIAALLTLLQLPAAGGLKAQPCPPAPTDDVREDIPDSPPDPGSPPAPSTEEFQEPEPAPSKPFDPPGQEDVFVDRDGDGIQDGKRHRFRQGCKRRKGRCGCRRWRGKGRRWRLRNSDP